MGAIIFGGKYVAVVLTSLVKDELTWRFVWSMKSRAFLPGVR